MTPQQHWTMRTAFELDALLVLLDARRNSAVDADLRGRLIAACNARDFSWAHADEAGIHHMRDGDRLHPTVTRSGLITWQQIWDAIGPGITDERVDELHAALAAPGGRAVNTPPCDRAFHAMAVFYHPAPGPVQLSLFDFAGAGGRR